MKNVRTEQELKNGFKDATGFSCADAPGSFNIFQKCVRWADSHPNKSVQSWMDEVTLLHQEIHNLKEQLQKYENR